MLDKHLEIASDCAEPISPYDDPDCRYVAMPEAMHTFAAPSLYDVSVEGDGRHILAQLKQGLVNCLNGVGSTPVDLSPHDAATVKFTRELLGTGEISILADRSGQSVMVDEAVFTGVWHVQIAQGGQLQQDYLETGDIPGIILATAKTQDLKAELPQTFPTGLMNAPALLHELSAKSGAFAAGREEIINLSLLPLSPEDNAFLVETLGLAGLSILSRGYGDCRISLTRFPHVWWVQYFNSGEQLILNTLEVTDMPQVALAAREDLEDTLERLRSISAELETVNET
ncbi:hydrogenase expression/formation protein [Candidatus Methylospira mobilis]|nr:hydrogenase expression/formation protein [Candidatus Methylospira mobilis]WNV05663.1 hydrogenase expression/formation protein [Candidatus Methylospira mobilis]